jgi:hypothetical protein
MWKDRHTLVAPPGSELRLFGALAEVSAKASPAATGEDVRRAGPTSSAQDLDHVAVEHHVRAPDALPVEPRRRTPRREPH